MGLFLFIFDIPLGPSYSLTVEYKGIVYILRGLPGMGKSTLASQLAASQFFVGTIVSADSFFMKDGEYKFNPALLGKAHNACFNHFMNCLETEVNVIVVDNTNTQRKEWSKYKVAAEKAGYQVQILTVGGTSEEDIKVSLERNVHKVPEANIRKMAARLKLD